VPREGGQFRAHCGVRISELAWPRARGNRRYTKWQHAAEVGAEVGELAVNANGHLLTPPTLVVDEAQPEPILGRPQDECVKPCSGRVQEDLQEHGGSCRSLPLAAAGLPAPRNAAGWTTALLATSGRVSDGAAASPTSAGAAMATAVAASTPAHSESDLELSPATCHADGCANRRGDGVTSGSASYLVCCPPNCSSDLRICRRRRLTG